MGLYKMGQLKLDELISREYQLEDLAHAFEDLIQGKNAKGVIVFD